MYTAFEERSTSTTPLIAREPVEESFEKNGHVTYRLDASKSVGSFSRALMLWRREKGKPAARRGRKA